MGDGTEQNPYTREDVLRLIEENGGVAKGLDLSGKKFETGIDLSGLNLEGIDLRNTIFVGATLRKTNLSASQLQGVNFVISDLQGTNLTYASLDDAQLLGTNLCEVDFTLVEFTSVKLGDINWGNYVLGEEKAGYYFSAEETYRRLKIYYSGKGMYDVAGKFFFREMTVKRKALRWWPNPLPQLWSKFLSLICGYGERPLRVIAWAASVVSVSTLIYFIIGSVWEWSAFWNSLYFSAVSFTALGYGSWLRVTNDWIRGIGAFESFIGVFTIALFLITFTRKMIR